jgi:uncharacterized protein DUF6629
MQGFWSENPVISANIESRMCFSAEASFIAAAGTGFIGLASFNRERSTSLRWLALVPGLFALQQASEDVVWLHLEGNIEAVLVGRIARYTYLMFAMIFWPIYAPLAVALSEKIQLRRMICLLIVIIGLAVSTFNAFQLVIGSETPAVLGHSIKYGYGDGYRSWRIFYGIVSMIPLFISSLRKVWILGGLALLGFAISDTLYYQAFISVWCFYAAITSTILYFILKDNEKDCAATLVSRIEIAADAVCTGDIGGGGRHT